MKNENKVKNAMSTTTEKKSLYNYLLEVLRPSRMDPPTANNAPTTEEALILDSVESGEVVCCCVLSVVLVGDCVATAVFPETTINE